MSKGFSESVSLKDDVVVIKILCIRYLPRRAVTCNVDVRSECNLAQIKNV